MEIILEEGVRDGALQRTPKGRGTQIRLAKLTTRWLNELKTMMEGTDPGFGVLQNLALNKFTPELFRIMMCLYSEAERHDLRQFGARIEGAYTAAQRGVVLRRGGAAAALDLIKR